MKMQKLLIPMARASSLRLSSHTLPYSYRNFTTLSVVCTPAYYARSSLRIFTPGALALLHGLTALKSSPCLVLFLCSRRRAPLLGAGPCRLSLSLAGPGLLFRRRVFIRRSFPFRGLWQAFFPHVHIFLVGQLLLPALPGPLRLHGHALGGALELFRVQRCQLAGHALYLHVSRRCPLPTQKDSRYGG